MYDYLPNVFVFDDFKPDIEDLLEVLQESFSDQLDVTNISTASTISEAVNKIKKLQSEDKIDILFLDLSIDDVTHSIIILDRLEKINFEIICNTSYPDLFQKVKDKYGAHVCGYIDKMARPSAINTQIQSALEVYRTKKELGAVQFGSSVRVKFNETKSGNPSKSYDHFVDAAEIFMIKSDGNYKNIHLTETEAKRIGQETIMARLGFDGLEFFFKNMGIGQFIRVHDKFMINMAYLCSYNKSDNIACLFYGKKVPVGPKYREDFRKILKNMALSPK